ncbi:histidine kinase [bacterium BMS3Abin03]|nr:histidine kinase [bacterium BMS3Abin03]
MLKYFKNISFLISVPLIFLSPSIVSQTDFATSSGGLVSILSENGLSQNTVHYILQDNDGFMWFATEDGLNKYDGYNFTIYKNDPHDKNSISDNFIWTIYQDKSGILWIGTNSGGLCRFDREKDRFISFKNDPSNPNSLSLNNVRAVCEDSDGNIWVGTENGLNKFNRKENSFTRYYHNPTDLKSLSNNVVLSIFEDSDGILWIGSDGGLDRYDKEKDNFKNYSFDPDNENSLTNNVVLTIYQDKSGYLWIGTLKGLTRFDKKKNEFTRYYVDGTEASSANRNRINYILEDKSNILWIGTGDGLFLFDRKMQRLNKIQPSNTGFGVFSNNNVLSVYEDNSGLVWIGTAEDGIVKYDKERIKFKNYKHNPFNLSSLSHNTIRAIYQDDLGTLWIGTLGGGLNKLDAKDGKFIHYINDPDDEYSLSDNSISAIFKDRYNYIWVGTWGSGLNRTVKPYKNSEHNNLKFVHYTNEQNNQTTGNQVNNSLSSNIIQAIYEDSNGNLWIGTGVGLDLFNREQNNFISFKYDPDNPNSLSSNQVQSCILQDRNENLWIGTWNGLNKISSGDVKKALVDPASVKFHRYTYEAGNNNGLSDERVISIYEDKNSNLWFGTYGGGLNELTVDEQGKSNGKFISYTVDDGLSSNIIYSIQCDDSDNLWLSTDNGLSRFDVKSKTFRNYDASDGLQGNQFFWGAGFKGKNGELFFGGTNGFNEFKPEELRNNNHVPPVVLTDFQIFNKPVEINNEDSPLKKSITYTKEIELTYGQNVFSFEFAALDFTAPAKNRYAYIMEGFDHDWISAGKRRYVTYTNLDPGEYVFRVKGSNNDGIWNESGTQVIIRILPPLWRTWWFVSSVLLLVGVIITLIIYFRVKHLLDIERLRIKLAADLHDNIGSSLTEISILSEVISKKIKTEDEGIRKSLNMISNSSRNLIDNMSDIVWLVNPKRDSLYDLILRLRDTYSELSSYTSISFRSENIKSLEKVSLPMEKRQHLYLIFKEAINNCITHSECSEITLDASVKGSKLLMTLKDNGIGFSPEIISNGGNGLSNIKERAKTIGGNLNIQSNFNQGTTVQFEGNIL